MPRTPPLVPILLAALAATAGAQDVDESSTDGIWQRRPANAATAMARTEAMASAVTPSAGDVYQLNRQAFDARLSTAPDENTTRVEASAAIITLPLPDRSYGRFAAVESPIMEAALAARFPQIRTYALAGLDRPSLRGRLDSTPAGIHAMVLTGQGAALIDPLPGSDGRLYRSHVDPADRVVCGVEDARGPGGLHSPIAGSRGDALTSPWAAAAVTNPSGDTLRTYRIAVATTGEYYQARGGTDLNVLGSIVVLMNRVNLLYQAEVAVSFVLAAGTTDLFFTDPDTDGYSNNSECAMRSENVAVVSANLGDDEYDVGHVFGSGSGGCAGSENVCTASKANGASNLNTNPMLEIGHEGFSGYRLVSHELGHQFGAGHTWSGIGGNCNGGQYSPGDAYEPGGGTTLMSYSGMCDSSNIHTTAADPYFHTHSFDQIAAFVNSGDGSMCGTAAPTGNTAPDVSAGPDYTIPRGTRFVLAGAAVDADGDAMTFTWEQYDLAPGPFAAGTDPGSGPLFRSLPPGPDPFRTFPRPSDILSNTTTPGELLPEFDRVGDPLTFRLIARDGRPAGGGVDYDSVEITVQGAPFRITSPNAFDVLHAGCAAPVTWDVGGGSVAARVDISISGDGGMTYSPLARGVPNDGAHDVRLTCDAVTQGRMKVAAADSIFFDISATDFIVVNDGPAFEAAARGGEVNGSCEAVATFTATITDDCGVNADTVAVEGIVRGDNADLSGLAFDTRQVDARTVGVKGSALVSNLTNGPATVLFAIEAADACGVSDGVTVDAEVADTTPPRIDVALTPGILWPPNHKMVDVSAAVAASDNCPGVQYVLTSVTSSEPDDSISGGDGATTGDIQGVELLTADTAFRLRAERLGAGSGRTYTAVYTAIDASGNETEDAAQVLVPGSKGGR